MFIWFSCFFSKYLPGCLAQAVYSAFCYSFPDSNKTFNSDDFLTYLTNLTSKWITGKLAIEVCHFLLYFSVYMISNWCRSAHTQIQQTCFFIHQVYLVLQKVGEVGHDIYLIPTTLWVQRSLHLIKFQLPMLHFQRRMVRVYIHCT